MGTHHCSIGRKGKGPAFEECELGSRSCWRCWSGAARPQNPRPECCSLWWSWAADGSTRSSTGVACCGQQSVQPASWLVLFPAFLDCLLIFLSGISCLVVSGQLLRSIRETDYRELNGRFWVSLSLVSNLDYGCGWQMRAWYCRWVSCSRTGRWWTWLCLQSPIVDRCFSIMNAEFACAAVLKRCSEKPPDIGAFLSGFLSKLVCKLGICTILCLDFLLWRSRSGSFFKLSDQFGIRKVLTTIGKEL